MVDTTATLMNGHCVGPNAPNTVYLLNANSGEHMSAIEERKAMSALTMAFLNNGRFQVTRGVSLEYEAYMAENTRTGREKLKETLARLSNSTITIFFVPVDRDWNNAYADVVFLARTGGNGDNRLGCGPSITVEIPVAADQSVEPSTETVPEQSGANRVVEFIKDFHHIANTRPCTDIGMFYASEFVVVTETRTLTRTLPEQIRMQCNIRKRHPVYNLHEDTIHVTELGEGKYQVTYSNTSEIDDERGGRILTDWFLDSTVEDQGGRLKFTRVELAASQR